MSVARKILYNTFSQIIGKAAIAILGIVTIKMLTNYLGDCGYGQYTTAFEFIAFFGIVADMGLYTVGVREMAKDEKRIPMIIGNILTMRTIVAILILGVSAVAAFLLPQYQGSKIPLAVILTGIASFLNLMTSTVSSVLQVHLKMQYNSFASVVGKIFSVVYMAVIIYVLYPQIITPEFPHGTYPETGFYQMMWAGITGNAVMLLVTYYYSSKLTHIRYRLDKEFLQDVIVKALPYGIALILNTLYFRIGSVMLSLLSPTREVVKEAAASCSETVDFSQVGIYGVPMRILETIGIVPLYFMNAVLPVLTRALQKKDGSHQKIIQYAYDFLVMGSLPIVAGTLVIAYQIIALISSPKFLTRASEGFYGSDAVLQIVIFAAAFSFINSLFGFILVADNRQVKVLTRNAIGFALTLIINFFLIPYLGARGAAITTVITECYVLFASYFIAKHYISFKIDFKNTLKMIFSATVMAIAVFYLRELTYPYIQNKNLLIIIPVAAFIYFGLLWITKVITPEMLSILKKGKNEPSTSEIPEL